MKCLWSNAHVKVATVQHLLQWLKQITHLIRLCGVQFTQFSDLVLVRICVFYMLITCSSFCAMSKWLFKRRPTVHFSCLTKLCEQQT